jgi:hypothetical protein
VGGKAIGVEHLGRGVFVQRLTVGLVDDLAVSTPSVITRRETHDVSRALISSLFWNPGMRESAVTGNPGIGKSRGILTHVLQQLLAARACVVLLAYKRNTAFLFVPMGETDWVVRTTTTETADIKDILRIRQVVALIDPPERREFVRDAKCFRLLFASTNAERYFRNFSKTSHLLYTSMLSEEELRAVTSELWTERTAGPNQAFSTLQEKQDEIVRRASLVGNTLRYLFDYFQFKSRCFAIVNSCKLETQNRDAPSLLKKVFSMIDPEQLSDTVSGRLLFVNSSVGPGATWELRTERCVVPNPLALSVLAKDKLPSQLGFEQMVYTMSHVGAVFEIFVSEMLRHFDIDANGQFVFRRSPRDLVWMNSHNVNKFMQRLNLEDGFVMGTDIATFEACDFALSSTHLVNSKVAGSKKFETKVGAAVTLLKRLGVLTGEGENLCVVPGKEAFRARLYFAHVHDQTFNKDNHEFVKGSKKWESSDEFVKAHELVTKHLDPQYVYVYGLAKQVLDKTAGDAKSVLESYNFKI